MADITKVVYLGTPGPPGSGITSGQWSALQAIVASDSTGNIVATGGSIRITRDGTISFLIEKADSTDVFIVNTTSQRVSLANGADLVIYSDNLSTAQFSVDGATGGIEDHFKVKSSAPSIAVGTALGSGGSVGATVTGTDQAGTILLTAGTSALTTGTAATITFHGARPDANYAVQLTPSNAGAGANAVQFRRGAILSGSWIVAFGVAPTSGTQYQYDYTIVEWTH